MDRAKEELRDLLEYSHDEIDYTYHAFRNDLFIDVDLIPFVKTGSQQLLIVFDAWEEICERIKKQEIERLKH